MDVVYISNKLNRYPFLYEGLCTNLKANGVKVVVLDTPNIWTRDYMPVQTKKGFIKFKYKTLAYEEWPQLHIDVDSDYWKGVFSAFQGLINSNIVLDGGNCQMNDEKDTAIITDVIFQHNPEYSREGLMAELSKLLECKIIVIPREPGDDLGHTDGIVKFANTHFVLLNDYSGSIPPSELGGWPEKDREWVETMDNYREEVALLLRKNYNIRDIRFPNYYHMCPEMDEGEFRKKYPEADDFNPGWGYSINFLKVNDLCLVPVFNIPEDKVVIDKIKQYYDCSVVALDCSDLSMEGGLINCVTREYKL